MEEINYVLRKYDLDSLNNSPMHIKDVGRRGLAKLFNELGYKIGAEVEVYGGEYSSVLCKQISGLTLFCIDSWKAYNGYEDMGNNQKKMDFSLSEAIRRTQMFDCRLKKMLSTEAVKEFDDNSLDFVYIDANHDFEHCTEDISNWSKKVKRGGIVSGHDFISCNKPDLVIHCKDVVEGWTKAKGISPWFVFDGDKSPSWCWIKI